MLHHSKEDENKRIQTMGPISVSQKLMRTNLGGAQVPKGGRRNSKKNRLFVFPKKY